jgi:hypothetical protein
MDYPAKRQRLQRYFRKSNPFLAFLVVLLVIATVIAVVGSGEPAIALPVAAIVVLWVIVKAFRGIRRPSSILIAAIIMLTVNGVRAQQPAATPTPTPANADEQPDANIIETKLHSAIMNEERRVIIHMPRNYSKDGSRKYPVIYVLDGTSQDQHTADKITVLSDAGLIPSAIVVGLPNTRGNRERDQTPPFMRRDVNEQCIWSGR